MRPLLILGTGVFAEEIADLAWEAGREVAGFVEGRDRSRCTDRLRGLPIHWIDDTAALSGSCEAVCAVGSTARSRFVARALDGALAQRTSFPFEVIVGEDCSTDRTREVVDAYAARHPGRIRVLERARRVGMVRNTSPRRISGSTCGTSRRRRLSCRASAARLRRVPPGTPESRASPFAAASAGRACSSSTPQGLASRGRGRRTPTARAPLCCCTPRARPPGRSWWRSGASRSAVLPGRSPRRFACRPTTRA